MKKIFILIFIFFTLTSFLLGKKPKEMVVSKIQVSDYQKVAIHYPVTQNSSLNQRIKKDVSSLYHRYQRAFSNQRVLSEFNVSYHESFMFGQYQIIRIDTTIKQEQTKDVKRYINTYIYDTFHKKRMSLSDFITKDELEKLVPRIQKSLLTNYKDSILVRQLQSKLQPEFQNFSFFTIDRDNLIFYFQSENINTRSNQILSVKIPLDSVGFKIEIERGVLKEIVQEKISIPQKVIEPNKKIIALTFDDGPSYYTDRILELLKKERVRATFFLIGNKINRYQDTVKQMLKDGNEIGNHSYSHQWLTKLTDDELKCEIEETQKVIQSLTGYLPKVFRPTYGAINQHLKEQVNLTPIMWTVDSSDWKIKNPNAIANRVFQSCKDRSIILMHDTHERTYEALKILIPRLKKEGYQFVTTSELEMINSIRNKETKNE